MKKILGIVPYTYLPSITGGHKAVATMYDNLAKGFTVVCIGTDRNDASKASYKMRNILSTSPLRYINFFNFFIIKSIIKIEKPDYLQIEHPYIGWLAVLLKSFTNIKLIVRSHNIEGLRFKNLNKWWWNILLRYEGWVHRNAEISYFITEEDRQYAIRHFKVKEQNSYTITFGINQTTKPTIEERKHAKRIVLHAQGLAEDDVIILFNGAFDYKPNIDALRHLVTQIFPLLKIQSNSSFKLIICGKKIPQEIIEQNKNPDIIFAGFVSDINSYIMAASVFVNPITEGGGIKTKLVEALGFDVTCVSYLTGAIGIPKQICDEKLLIVEDKNVEQFANSIMKAASIQSSIPRDFYNHFSNDKILEKVKSIL